MINENSSRLIKIHHLLFWVVIACAVLILTPLSCIGEPEYKKEHTIGIGLLEQESWEEAITHFDKSIDLNKEYAPVHVDRGFANYKLNNIEQAFKDYSEAMLMFKKSVEIDPQNVSAHRQLAAVSALGLITGDVTA